VYVSSTQRALKYERNEDNCEWNSEQKGVDALERVLSSRYTKAGEGITEGGLKKRERRGE
jgi:hypothetical protein